MTLPELVYLAAGVVAIFAIVGALGADARELARWATNHHGMAHRDGRPVLYTRELPPTVAGSGWHALGLAAILALFLGAAMLR